MIFLWFECSLTIEKHSGEQVKHLLRSTYNMYNWDVNVSKGI